MKTKIKLLTIVAVVAAFMFSFSCQNRVKEKDVSGTIGKVEKYHKDQMSENDILLRSEIISDTAELANIIRGMLIFHAYADALSDELNKNATDIESSQANVNNQLGIEELKDYCEFVKNRNETLASTIAMYWDIYNDTVTEISFDVEQHMKNFINYYSQLNAKATVVDDVVEKSDQWIEENSAIEGNENEIERLKKLRDEVLLRDMQMAFVLGNNEKLGFILDKALFDMGSLNVLGILADNESLGSLVLAVNPQLSGISQIPAAQENLNSFMATGELNFFIAAALGNEILSDNEALAAGPGIPLQSIELLSSNLLNSDQAFINSFNGLFNNERLNIVLARVFSNINSYDDLNDFIITDQAHLGSYVGSFLLFHQDLGNRAGLQGFVI
ncbi:MAG: hypothetical protein KAT48_07030 [Bacteroidales bacterium]|nr:hypothetical protein [Bacteroidales bacterium]